MAVYRNLEGTTFIEPPVGSWYNLETHRKITKPPARRRDFLLHDSPRVAGPPHLVARFLELNADRREPPVPEYAGVGPKSPTFYGIPIPKFLRPQTPEVAPLCKPGQAGTALYYPETTDVAAVPSSELETLCEFTLTGLRVKAKVLNVVDGDTLDLAFFVPMTFLGAAQVQGRGVKTRTVRSVLPFAQDRGFFARMRVRLSEIDTAEKGTNKGVIAKKLLERRLAKIDSIVYAHLLKFEKYGRLLAEVYEDENYSVNIRTSLLAFIHPVLGAVAVPYGGGKKQPWPKTPPQFVLEPEYR